MDEVMHIHPVHKLPAVHGTGGNELSGKSRVEFGMFVNSFAAHFLVYNSCKPLEGSKSTRQAEPFVVHVPVGETSIAKRRTAWALQLIPQWVPEVQRPNGWNKGKWTSFLFWFNISTTDWRPFPVQTDRMLLCVSSEQCSTRTGQYLCCLFSPKEGRRYMCVMSWWAEWIDISSLPRKY